MLRRSMNINKKSYLYRLYFRINRFFRLRFKRNYYWKLGKYSSFYKYHKLVRRSLYGTLLFFKRYRIHEEPLSFVNDYLDTRYHIISLFSTEDAISLKSKALIEKNLLFVRGLKQYSALFGIKAIKRNKSGKNKRYHKLSNRYENIEANAKLRSVNKNKMLRFKQPISKYRYKRRRKLFVKRNKHANLALAAAIIKKNRNFRHRKKHKSKHVSLPLRDSSNLSIFFNRTKKYKSIHKRKRIKRKKYKSFLYNTFYCAIVKRNLSTILNIMH